MNDKNRNFENANVGVIVILEERNRESIYTISRLTKTQIFISINPNYEMKFNRKSGYLIGSSGWNLSSIYIPTSEQFIIVKNNNRKLILAHKLRSTDFFSLDLPTLENLFKLLPEK